MSLTAKYDAAIASHDIVNDPVQRQLLMPLEQLTAALAIPARRWFSFVKKPITMGYYLYGPVGVGKTFLMDLFYDNVAITQKKRFHFHHFMQQVDAQLRRLQGQKNPLKHIATELANSTRLLCFDEFMVADVAHAMILAELLQELFAQDVVLVATSNTLPDDLYRNGPHRVRFLPAITAIKSRCHVISLGDQRDYRLGREPELDTYLISSGESSRCELQRQFDMLATDGPSSTVLHIQNREIICIKWRERVVWFDFRVICNLPRSQLDYLEIADRFDTIIVSDIPLLQEKDTVFAILLVNFVDVMYDRGIRLILSAAVPVNELYTQGEMSQEFKRTASRLHEMQSVDYLTRHPHRYEQSLTSPSEK